MSSLSAQEWLRVHVRDVAETQRCALAVLKRHGWTPGDLDYLLYEAAAGDPGEGDDAFAGALDVLARMREAGVTIG
jgi:hypothetical protein